MTDCLFPGFANAVMSASPPGNVTSAARAPSTYTTARVCSIVNVRTTRLPAASAGISKSRRYQARSFSNDLMPWSSNQSESHTSCALYPQLLGELHTDGIFPQPQLSSGPGATPAASFVSAGRNPQRPFSDQRARVADDVFHAPSSDHGSVCAVAQERDPPVAHACDPPAWRYPSGRGALQGLRARLRFTDSVIGPNSTVPAVPKLLRPMLSITAPSGIGKSRTQSVQSCVPA